ncbi:MAG TPA: hypothetical protein VFE23_08865 [Usitatibacter sp.]|jgi:hypothetical protein|nr:hypothetical protein [Usitatibacter sp.]
MTMRFLRLCLAAAFLSLPLAAWSQDQAFTNRATELKERADAASATLVPLPENTAVKVLARAGAWTRVEAAGRPGFVRVFHLRFPATVEAAGSGSSNPFAAFGSLIGGSKSDAHANLATTGVRGLSKEDVKNANPDAEALKRMQSYRADKPAAERFAREGKLAAVKVADPDAGSTKGSAR